MVQQGHAVFRHISLKHMTTHCIAMHETCVLVAAAPRSVNWADRQLCTIPPVLAGLHRCINITTSKIPQSCDTLISAHIKPRLAGEPDQNTPLHPNCSM